MLSPLPAVLAVTFVLVFGGFIPDESRAQDTTTTEETTTTTGFGVPTDDGEGRRIEGDLVVGGDGVEVNVGTDRVGFDPPVPLALIFLGFGVIVLAVIGIVIRRFGEL